MNLDQLFRVFERAHEISQQRDYVVIGSLSVLGVDDDTPIPGEMSMSIDIDCYTKADPARVFDLKAALGEDSQFHATHGYYLDPVSPNLPSLPDGWESRMMSVERAGLRIWFLDPDDAAVSKYARGDPRDVRWIRAGLTAGLISLRTVRSRIKTTTFLDEEEDRRVRKQVGVDSAWFETVKAQRSQASRDGGN